VGVLACAAPAADTQPARPDAPVGARVTGLGWFAPIEPEFPPPELPSEVARAFVIPIHGEINNALYDIVRRKVAQCKGKGAELVVFDMDTPGGNVEAMDAIVDLATVELSGVRTVAYVNPRAFSAGAVISLGCNEIAMSPMGKMGAAMSILGGPGGIRELPERVRGKFDSADRTRMRALARRNGHQPLLCEAMSAIDLVVWLIRNTRTGELRFVRADDWRGVARAPATTRPAAAPQAARPDWEFLRTVVGPRELVAVTADEARFMGFARHTFASADDLMAHYNVTAAPVVLTDTWSERMVRWLSSAAVTSVLLGIGMLALLLELRTPGVGVPGLVALVFLGLAFGSRYLVGMAAWWEIALFVVGVLLLLAEILVIPGFGVAGIGGIVCCLVALLAMFVSNPPSELPIPRTPLDWETFSSGLLVVFLALLGAMVVGGVLAHYLPKLPGRNRLMLAAVPASEEAPASDESPLRRVRVGDRGVVASTCRPVGKVRFGDDLLDAVTEGGMIPVGRKVRVLRSDGNRIVIEPVEEA
jgi:membrane-bound serine protease (ClpP class)